MGKRELLLIFCFVIVGVVVHQLTARPPAPGERGFSLSRIIESARREIRGNRATAEATTTATHVLAPDVTELRIVAVVSDVEVTGEDREDVESTFRVESRAYDEAEAREYLKQSRLLADRASAALILRMDFPRGGRQRGVLKVKAPSRLQIRVEGAASLKVSNVSALEVEGTRGDATVRQIPGKVDFSHRGGEVEIENVGALEFTGRSGTLKVAGVKGDASIRMEQGGEVRASRLDGAIDVEGRNCDIALDDLSAAKGPIRVNVNGGSLKVKGLKSDARIDSRNAEVEVAMAAPAPVAIYGNGERISLTPPPGGYTLDARVTDGRVTPDDFIESMGFTTGKPSDSQQTVSGAIKGGGPTISVRATNADFTVRQAEDKTRPSEKPDTKS